jgi:hemerythrin-like metal-binding protein
MAIEWGQQLSTGVPWQDREHKEFFKRLNELVSAIERGEGEEEVGRLFKFLDDYMVTHFHHEEQAMSRYGYPDILTHLEEHTHFIDDLSRLKKESLQCGSGLAEQVRSRLVDWLVDHIGSTDKALGAFLNQRPGEKAP